MASGTDEIAHEFLPSHPIFRVYKGGRVERLRGTETVPPSPTPDPQTGVQSKDAVVSSTIGLSARLFIPKITDPTQKLPLLVYIHGGAFCIESPFSPLYHNYLTTLVAQSNVLAVSIDYRKAPEHPLPTAYDDSWTAIEWVASHVGKNGPEPWLNNHADFQRVFFAGDSAGANIAHNMVVKIGDNRLSSLRILGLILMHPFFLNSKRDKLIEYIFPSSRGFNDPRLNPAIAPEVLAKLACSKVLICVAGKDWLKDRGWSYYEALRKTEWGGGLEIVETEGEDHVFHLFNPSAEKSVELMKRVASFMSIIMSRH